MRRLHDHIEPQTLRYLLSISRIALPLLVLLLASSMSSAQSGAQPSNPTFKLTPLPRSSNELQINPGDLLDIQVFNTPELSAKHLVSQSGKIRLTGTGDIEVQGMTPLEAGAEIERRLRSSEVMLNPQVTVLIQEHATRQISVLGEVNRPGTYPIQGWPSLANVLAAAGGVTPKEGSTITITHRNDPGHPETVRVSAGSPAGNDASLTLQSSDMVFVSQAGLIYVIGDVGKPGEFYIGNGRPLRALEAIALAEGLKENARPDKAAIIRTTATGAETIPVNLSRVQRNTALDPVLEPSDVLVVPHSGFKEFELSVLPSLTGAAANAVALALVSR